MVAIAPRPRRSRVGVVLFRRWHRPVTLPVIALIARLGDWYGVSLVDPPTKVDQPASLAAERKRRQVVYCVDLYGFGADRATHVHHVSLFGAGPAFAGSLFEEPVDSLDFDSLDFDSLGFDSLGFDSLGFDSLDFDSLDFDSLAGFEGSLDALSAWAAFLYDSLR
jgi:hypothetical protein